MTDAAKIADHTEEARVMVTQEDREAAASVAVLAEMRELILSGRADHHAEPWALHRQRGKLEGARLALEEVSLIIHDQDRETVAALDPAKIVGEG